jgi:parallel beta-helix repeat protein
MTSGGNQTVWIRGFVLSDALGIINNTANVTTTTNDSNLGNNTANTITTINTLADIYITKSAPSSVVAGQDTLTFTILVGNNGPSVARAVTMNDNSTDLIKLSNLQYSTNGSTWNTWLGTLSLGNITSGSNQTVWIRGSVLSDALGIINNTANLTTTTTDPTPGNNSANTLTTINTLADIYITNSASQNPVIAGQDTLTYTLLVGNKGPSYARAVTLNDNSADFSKLNNIQYSTNGSTWSTWYGSLIMGDMAPNTNQTVWIRGSVNSDALGIINNTANVTTTTTDATLGNNTSNTVTTINTLADIYVTKLASPNPVIAGQDTLIFTIFVKNNGPSVARSVTLNDNSADLSKLSNVQYSTNGSTWNNWVGSLALGNMTSGSNQTVWIRGSVNSDALGVINNTANVTTSTNDSSLVNNTANTLTTINTLADIYVTMSASPEPVVAGQDTLTYTLLVGNNGPSTARGVILNDNSADLGKLSSVQYSTNGSSWSSWSGSYLIGDLASGTNQTLWIRGSVPGDALGTINNTANLTTTTGEVILGNNTASILTNIVTVADVYITKSAPSSVMAGQHSMTFTILVGNNGPSVARNVILNDNSTDFSKLNSIQYSTDGSSWNDWTGILSLGDLSSGVNQTVWIRGNVLYTAIGVINNTANVTTTTNDAFLTNNTANSITSIIVGPIYVNTNMGNDTWDGTSATWISGTNGPMKTIQTALSALVNGGTINVATGTYAESLVFDQKYVLVGDGLGATVLSPASVGSNVVLVNVGGQGSSINGFNITGATGVAAIMLNNVNDTLIHNNTISGNTIGIAFNNAGNNTVSNVLLANNGAALQIYRSNLNTVNNCTFTSNDYGVYLLEANNNNISNSLFTVTNGNGRALYLESGQGNQINSNTITGGVYGIESLNDYQNIYNGNDISGTAWRNIYFTNPELDIITGNRIHDTINGLLLVGGSQNQLVGNTLFGCGSGLEVVNSFNNTLNDNNITQNTFGMYIYGNTGTTISQNNVTNCGSAIELHDSSENTVNNNNLAMNTFGVYIAGGLLNAVENNIVFNTLYGGAGVHFEDTSNNTINDNSFTSDVKDFRYGIYINEGSNNTITNNNASNNHAGLELHNTNLNQVNGNSLNNNTVALFMDNSSENVFISNAVTSNGAGVEMHNSHLNTFNAMNITGSTFGFIIFNGNNNTIINSILNSNGAAINLQTCINTTIDNNLMNNNSYGVYILNGDHNTVQNSQVTDIKLDGSGVFLDNTTQNTVKQNSFINTEKLFTYGVYQTGGSNNILESNTAIRNHAGIELHDTTSNLIISNSLSYNTLGVFMWASSHNNLTSNIISNNGAGIEIHQSTENNLTGNNLSNNVYGFYLDQLTSSNIKTNNFTSNTIGLYSDNSNSNAIYTNNFNTNDTQAYDTGSNNWDNGVNTGNCWSDYSGSGVYEIMGGSNIDHYPTKTLF